MNFKDEIEKQQKLLEEMRQSEAKISNKHKDLEAKIRIVGNKIEKHIDERNNLSIGKLVSGLGVKPKKSKH